MVSFTGVGLGAFAQESRLLGDQRIRRKLSDLQETQLRQQQQTAVRENINDLVGAAAGVAERAAEVGRDPTASIAELRERVALTAQAGGLNPDEFTAMFDAATTGFAGPAERGVAVGTESAAKLTGELGRLPTTTERERSAGVEEPNPNVVNFRVGDSFESINVNDPAALADVLDRGGVRVGLDVQASDVSGLDFEKGTKKEAEGRVLQTQTLLRNTATLEGLLAEGGAVGAVPAFRGLLNVTVAQFVPGSFDKDRAQFERFNKLTRQAALRVVSDESRFSEADRDFIFDLFPETGAFESEQNAAVKLRVMQAFFLRRLEPDLVASGIDPDSINVGLGPDEVRDAVQRGFLSADEGVRILDKLFPDFLDQLGGGSGG